MKIKCGQSQFRGQILSFNGKGAVERYAEGWSQEVLRFKKFGNHCSNASVLHGLLRNKISVMSRGEIIHMRGF